jgi:[NiFe] hydrogenase diaphorase moiety large subunit
MWKKPSHSNPLTFSSIEAEKGMNAALKSSPQDVIEYVKKSGMRGRGGAGFPTGLKWQLAAQTKDDAKIVVCNADEGEPGTFKDRYIIKIFGGLMIEGMTIAAYAIGSKRGIIYLRGEYTYLRPHLEALFEERRKAGKLGKDINGIKGFEFNIEVRMGAGAYVCGEETALIESLEGQRGEPRNRPPFPVNTGFQGHSTIVNNVETFAWVTCMFVKGIDWFRSQGTEKSTGGKLFSVSGDCKQPGIYEFPLGIKVSKLLEAVGGEDAKAVQIGGAAGLLIPKSEFGRTLAYEDIPTGGSIIVFGPERDMLMVAKNFLEFFVHESCGQCTPCREGNEKLLEGIIMLEEGRCSMHYLNELVSLGETMRLTSKCGLGQTSSNPFTSVATHFRDEILGRTEFSASEPTRR